MALLAVVASLAVMLCNVNAQFPPTPEGTTTVPSRFNNGVVLSYKQVCIQLLHLMSKDEEETRMPKIGGNFNDRWKPVFSNNSALPTIWLKLKIGGLIRIPIS